MPSRKAIEKCLKKCKENIEVFSIQLRWEILGIESLKEDVLDTGMTYKGTYLSYVDGRWIEAEKQSSELPKLFHY